MATAHQWINRYRAPLAGGQVITKERPGEKIARAISEIQEVLDNILGADGAGESMPTTTEMNTAIEAAVSETSAIQTRIDARVPEPPASGDYVLMSINGVPQWIQLQEFSCPL